MKKETKIEQKENDQEVVTKKKLPLWSKITIGVVGGLVGGFCVAIAGCNIFKFAVYHDYYKAETTLCKIPGINDGFIPQNIGAVEDSESAENDQYILSGYMKDGSASRLYVTNKQNKSHYVTLRDLITDEEFTGHCGGIAITGGKVYTTDCDKEVSTVIAASLTAVLNEDNNGESLQYTTVLTPNNHASFLFTDDNYLYVGEFHKEGSAYLSLESHYFETETEGTHHAIVSRYNLDDLSAGPDLIYSIRDLVQGFAILSDGTIVMSTSWALASSHYYVYSSDCVKATDKTLDGAPVYIIENPTKVIKGPAMAEGLDVTRDDQIITVTESASTKYIFGRFFNAWDCNMLNFKD